MDTQGCNVSSYKNIPPSPYEDIKRVYSMKYPMKSFTVQSQQRNEMIDITDTVKSCIKENGIINGIAIVYVPHTTAGVTINEGADPDVQRDIITALNRLIPENGDYHHAEGNSDAHIKASLLGSSVTIIVDNGNLVLGTWQHVFFYEGDGSRKRTVYIEMIAKEKIQNNF
jgi:secondary thiamine-phosphate synthase enzyme